MPSKALREPKPERLWVDRGKLSRIMALTPPTEEQRAILATGMVKSWPNHYEMFPTPDVKQVLSELNVVWTDKK